jgi:hypothetical protein
MLQLLQEIAIIAIVSYGSFIIARAIVLPVIDYFCGETDV